MFADRRLPKYFYNIKSEGISNDIYLEYITNSKDIGEVSEGSKNTGIENHLWFLMEQIKREYTFLRKDTNNILGAKIHRYKRSLYNNSSNSGNSYRIVGDIGRIVQDEEKWLGVRERKN